MPQAMVNFRMDENLKKSMEQTCKDLGMSMTTAFTIFATKVAREKRIPFDVALHDSPDPFYSDRNMAVLAQRIQALEAGKAKLVAHELIEA